MAIAIILSCRFCRRDFEHEISRGRRPSVCDACRESGLSSTMQSKRLGAPELRSANADVDAGVLYRNGRPLFAAPLREYNSRLLRKPLTDVARGMADQFLAAG